MREDVDGIHVSDVAHQLKLFVCITARISVSNIRLNFSLIRQQVSSPKLQIILLLRLFWINY